MTRSPLKIVSLDAENVKRLRAVHITPDPDGSLVVIAGRNAQGKTSVLDSIWLALGGATASKRTPRPVRDGEKHASVTLNLGDLIVTRTWDADGKSKLTVASADGARYNSPQAMLDGLVGRLSFDPLAFVQADGKTQRQQLLELVDLPVDLEALDTERQQVFEERTGVNRAIKDVTAQLGGMPKPAPGLPDAEQSASDLLAQVREAESAVQRWHDIQAAKADADEAVGRAAKTLQEALDRQKAANIAVDNTPSVTADPAVILQQLEQLEQTNAAVRAAAARREHEERLARLTARAGAHTDRLAAIDSERATALAAAAMPIDGLGLDDDGVTYQGAPLKQASGAEQLRVSIAMAMALNPSIRVIRITDGSLLDSTNLALIEQMATEHGFQVWLERVDETGAMGVVIEDGAVAPALTAVSA